MLGNRTQHRGTSTPRVLNRLVQKCPAARNHDLLGSKFLRNVYNVLKVRECAGTRLIPARRDIPRLGVVLFGTKPHNPNPIPL